jgi:hypothetical protein
MLELAGVLVVEDEPAVTLKVRDTEAGGV